MGQLNIKDLKLCMVEVLLVEVCGSTMCKSLLSSAEKTVVDNATFRSVCFDRLQVRSSIVPTDVSFAKDHKTQCHYFP